jgi:hypothetical protein
MSALGQKQTFSVVIYICFTPESGHSSARRFDELKTLSRTLHQSRMLESKVLNHGDHMIGRPWLFKQTFSVEIEMSKLRTGIA